MSFWQNMTNRPIQPVSRPAPLGLAFRPTPRRRPARSGVRRLLAKLTPWCAVGWATLWTVGSATGARPPETVRASDPVVFSFCTVGDSRADAKEPALSAQDRLWLQNTKVLSRLIREVQAQKPNVLFFNGDMIMGYSTNHHVLDREYAYWRGMMSALLETGTYLVPVPGNHEVQIKWQEDPEEEPVKFAQREGEAAWRENMGDLILDTNLWRRLVCHPPTAWDQNHAPPIGGPDRILSDQRQLSFSFDCQDLHFAIINTDPYGNDSHAPVSWLREDLSQARQRGMRHCFVFGHKMAYTYRYKPDLKSKGLDAFPVAAEAFWQVIEDHGATYFCGHEHIYHAMQPLHSGPHGAWQIIVGSGGSPFEAQPGDSSNPHDRLYVWARVEVHQSGRVHLEANGFDEFFGATKRIQSLELSAPFREQLGLAPQLQ